MKEYYELKEKLCDELKEYGKKDMSAGSLDVIDKLTHTIKNLNKIIEEDEGYSHGRYYMDGSYDSYGRRRDSMGRYSREHSYDDGMINELRELMNNTHDESKRQEFKKFINRIENM